LKYGYSTDCFIDRHIHRQIEGSTRSARVDAQAPAAHVFVLISHCNFLFSCFPHIALAAPTAAVQSDPQAASVFSPFARFPMKRMGEIKRHKAYEVEQRTGQRFASTFVIAASIIVAVRLARDDISRQLPRLLAAVTDSITLAHTILDGVLWRYRPHIEKGYHSYGFVSFRYW